MTKPTHQGPHPDHGGLTTHIGARENCSAPDCGPPDPEEEIREAVLVLEAHLDDPELTKGPWLSTCHGDRLIHARPDHDKHQPIRVVDEPMSNGANADYIALMHPGVGRLLVELLHEIAEDWGLKLDPRQAIQQAAHKIATSIAQGWQCDAADPSAPTAPAAPQPPVETRPDLTVRLVSISPSAAGIVEELGAAASVLREHLEDRDLTPAPWLSMCRGDRLVHAGLDHDRRPAVYVVDEPMSNGANADYIAVMHPGIGEVIAKWLADSASLVVRRADVADAEQSVGHALAAARLINSRPR